MNDEPALYLATQIGSLSLELEGKNLLSLSINEKGSKVDNCEIPITEPKNDAKQAIFLQLKQYFSSAISFQDITLAPHGTSFQKSVWEELTKIPKGETRTYGQIASNLNSSARAVGNACRQNPIAIIIPCHRVISAKGIGGYAGQTEGKQLEIKQWLLNHEGVSL